MRGITILAALVIVATSAGVAVSGPVAAIDCSADPNPECEGTPSPDVITGEDVDDGVDGADDEIDALGGRDQVDARSGDDVIRGGDSGDSILGGEGDDRILGGGGEDVKLSGGGGDDVVLGGATNDGILDDPEGDLEGGIGDNVVKGGRNNDAIDANESGPGDVERLFGGNRPDQITAADGQRDVIDCGRGTDSVQFDLGIDKLKSCEFKDPVSDG
ncbi:hypothetical protein HJD18_11225 [Thermoleophilia bacterium SCSIO 60948]|nr:hypothetical protein HJD18_11225 [Thermoleophilia bacterium SCSIO 60948]